jgi:transposase
MKLLEEQLLELRAAVKPDTYDGSVSARAQLVLWYYEGRRKTDIAKMSGTTRPAIDKWIGRYEHYGLAGLASRV